MYYGLYILSIRRIFPWLMDERNRNIKKKHKNIKNKTVKRVRDNLGSGEKATGVCLGLTGHHVSLKCQLLHVCTQLVPVFT